MASIKFTAVTRRISTRSPGSLRQLRHFSRSLPCMLNPLLDLSKFSAAKEAQFLSKAQNIPREEYHPYLQLIRSSEVDPFAPVPGASPSVIAALDKAKTGKVDAEATYTLALSNLMSQVAQSRRENLQITSALMMMQDKHKREERDVFLVMLAAVGVFSFIALKTRALADLKEYVFGVKNQVDDFDWKWLGNPPSHVLDSRRMKPALSGDVARNSFGSQISVVPVDQAEVQVAQAVSVDVLAASEESRWTFSRLFWAS